MSLQGWIGNSDFETRATALLRRYDLPLKKPINLSDEDEARWLIMQWDMLNERNPEEAYGIKHEYAEMLRALVRQTNKIHRANLI